MNVAFISHGDFTTNSALHVYAIARELDARGRFRPAIVIPDNLGSVEEVSSPTFPVATFRDVRDGRLAFADGRPADIVHSFTAREHVRKVATRLLRAHGARSVVHLEDNDAAVSASVRRQARLRWLPSPILDRLIGARLTHPTRAREFVERADGATVVIERLQELVPDGVATAVVHAGYDPAMLHPTKSRENVRDELRLGEAFVVLYTGNVHAANLDDMRELYDAIRLLRAGGAPVVLVKTGRDTRAAAKLPTLGNAVRDVGWVRRSELSSLLGAADVLVQPGFPGAFNDYRFPSKVPDFLVSGKPVVLTRTNIGLSLRDGEDAIVVERGTASELAQAVARLLEDPIRAAAIGAAGREFALRELSWASSVDHVEALYAAVTA